MAHFDARLSPFLKGFTSILTIVAVAGAAYALVEGRILIAAALLGALLALSLLSVRGYTIHAGRLRIQRVGWVTEIDLSGLTEASTAGDLVKRSVSVWSTRGLFGVIGFAHRKGLGMYRVYVTNPSNAVLLRFQSRRPVVVSPESPEAFVTAVTTGSMVPTRGDAPTVRPRAPP